MDSISRKEKEKLAREEDIINAAEKVFTIMGYGGASMEEIAKEAQFTRKTVYQYFADKEDLFFAVIIRGYKRLLSYFKDDINSDRALGITGFQKLKKVSSAYYRFYLDFPGTLKLMNYVGYIRSIKENTERCEEFNNISKLMVEEISKLIDEGKRDGSIRSDLDTANLTYSIEFIVTGFFHMLSISGKTFTTHFAINEKSFIDFSMNLLSDALAKKD